jgi:hypothetical protein
MEAVVNSGNKRVVACGSVCDIEYLNAGKYLLKWDSESLMLADGHSRFPREPWRESMLHVK